MRRQPHDRQRARSVRALLLAAVTTLPAIEGPRSVRAATAAWTNSAGGTFSFAANWNGGTGPAPGTSDIASFSLDAAYTVTFAGATTTFNNNTSITAGNITFLASGTTRNYVVTNGLGPRAGSTLTIGSAGTPAMQVGAFTFGPWMGGTINVLNGISEGSNFVTAGGTSNGVTAPATINISGADTRLNGGQLAVGGTQAQDMGAVTYADGAGGTFSGTVALNNGSLTLNSGADLLATKEVNIGGSTSVGGAPVSLTLSGAGSTFNQSTFIFPFTVGAASGNVTSVSVNDSAALSTQGFITLRKTATLDFTGGTVSSGNGILVDGGVLRSTASTGTFVTTGGTPIMTVQNGGRADITGPFNVGASGSHKTLTVTGATSQFNTSGELYVRETVNVQAGAKLTSGSIRSEFGSMITVDGAGSTLITGGLEQNYYADFVRVKNGASATFNGNIKLQGSIDLSAGGQASAAGQIDIVGAASGGIAQLSLSGGSGGTTSTLTQTGSGGIVVGTVSGGSGSITGSGGGTLITGTGGLTVHPRGQITGGTVAVNANGDVTFNATSAGNISSLATINLAAGKSLTLSTARVDVGGAVTLPGTNTLAVTGANALLTANALSIAGGGTATFSAAGSLIANTLSVTGGSALTITGATSNASVQGGVGTNVTVGGAVGSGSSTIDVANGGTLTGGNTLVNPTGAVTITASTFSANALTINGGRVTLNSGKLRVGGSGFVTATNGGQLDLKGNAMVATLTPLGTASGGTYTGVTGVVQAGRNGGAWNGAGIVTSSSDAASGLTSLGVATADQLGRVGTTYASWSLASGDVIVAYTYAGDANLDGIISGDDYAAIDFNIATPGASGWFNGDFNYDGILSGDDYSIIDFNIVAQGAAIMHGASGGGATAVPEPATGLAFLATATVLRRFRRRQVR